MVQVEAFHEFRAGLALLRGGDANKALPHLKCAFEEEPANPFYISYMGVAIAATEHKWAEAEELCRSAIRMSRRQAQEALEVDVRDLRVNIRDRLAQDSTHPAFSKKKREAPAEEGSG